MRWANTGTQLVSQQTMAFHLTRTLCLCSILLLLLQLWATAEAAPQSSNETQQVQRFARHVGNGKAMDNSTADSSSEETVEASKESKSRERRDTTNRAGIPGLPDPATIIKVAQLFQSIGEQIVPVLLETLLPTANAEAGGERFARDIQLLRSLQRSLEQHSNETQTN